MKQDMQIKSLLKIISEGIYEKLRNTTIDPAMMGFPSNWRQEPLWQL